MSCLSACSNVLWPAIVGALFSGAPVRTPNASHWVAVATQLRQDGIPLTRPSQRWLVPGAVMLSVAGSGVVGWRRLSRRYTPPGPDV
ncbi:MAG: hypothetical protein J2P28_10850 [Actinobacteria bacterium]|nr:hypothetical protein [Actinomycetota bacterium]